MADATNKGDKDLRAIVKTAIVGTIIALTLPILLNAFLPPKLTLYIRHGAEACFAYLITTGGAAGAAVGVLAAVVAARLRTRRTSRGALLAYGVVGMLTGSSVYQLLPVKTEGFATVVLGVYTQTKDGYLIPSPESDLIATHIELALRKAFSEHVCAKRLRYTVTRSRVSSFQLLRLDAGTIADHVIHKYRERYAFAMWGIADENGKLLTYQTDYLLAESSTFGPVKFANDQFIQSYNGEPMARASAISFYGLTIGAIVGQSGAHMLANRNVHAAMACFDDSDRLFLLSRASLDRYPQFSQLLFDHKSYWSQMISYNRGLYQSKANLVMASADNFRDVAILNPYYPFSSLDQYKQWADLQMQHCIASRLAGKSSCLDDFKPPPSLDLGLPVLVRIKKLESKAVRNRLFEQLSRSFPSNPAVDRKSVV